MKSIIIFTSLILICFSATAQHEALPAKLITDAAYRQASDQNKKVLIIFHASWCGWCHKMDNSINDPSCKKFFDDNYVIAHLTVDESAPNKNLENVGADKFRKSYKGDKAGLPFWLIMDENGKLLADSQIRPKGSSLNTAGANIGCPANEEEITAFAKILKNTSALTDADLKIIAKRFAQNKE